MFCWTAHLRAGPETHRAVAVGSRLYSFGVPCVASGVDFPPPDPGGQIQVHVLDTVSLRWSLVPPATTRWGKRPLEVPPERTGYSAALVDDAVYVWGGYPSGGSASKLWTALHAFDTDGHRWARPAVSGPVPEARKQHSACVFGTRMYVHGGFNKLRYLHTVHRLDVRTMVWTLVGGGGGGGVTPPASTCHSATAVGSRMLVLGGRGDEDEDEYRKVREFDTRSERWERKAAAHPEGVNNNHGAFALGGRLYVFGGYNDANALWSFDPTRRDGDGGAPSWRKVATRGGASAPPRHATPSHGPWCCCIMGDGRVLFGGCSELYVLEPRPSLSTLCQLALLHAPRHGLMMSPADVRRGLLERRSTTMMMSPDDVRRRKVAAAATTSDKQRKHGIISLVLPRERGREAECHP